MMLAHGFSTDILFDLVKAGLARRPPSAWCPAADRLTCAAGAVSVRIMKVHAAPVGMSWMWTLAFEHHEDPTPTHGYAATSEAAMGAFARSWRRE
jgi:hypothetical protein